MILMDVAVAPMLAVLGGMILLGLLAAAAIVALAVVLIRKAIKK